MEAASFVVGKSQGVEAADVRAPLLRMGLLHQKKSSCCCVAVVPSAVSGSASRVFVWRAHARPPKQQGFVLRALSKNKHGPQGSVQHSVLHWRGGAAESPCNKRVLQILFLAPLYRLFRRRRKNPFSKSYWRAKNPSSTNEYSKRPICSYWRRRKNKKWSF
jgi:hypothetical protein